MKNFEDNPEETASRLYRNRSILLCRDLLEMNDWVILSCKQSQCAPGVPGDATELFSIAVIGAQRSLLDVFVKPHGAVTNELLRMHGCDSAHTFNGSSFSEVHKILHAGFGKTRVICWEPKAAKSILSQLCKQDKLSELQANFLDFQAVFSSFVGESLESDPEKGCKLQELPAQADSKLPGVTPMAECQFIKTLVHEVAASSQSSDSLAFNKNWSAAFYKPKLGPTKKIKEILGIGD